MLESMEFYSPERMTTTGERVGWGVKADWKKKNMVLRERFVYQ